MPGWVGRAAVAVGIGWVLAAGTMAQAQDEPPRFEQTVFVTPAASPVSFETVPRQVLVLDKAAIASLPAHSVADVLSYAAGVDVRSRGPAGVQSDFSLRGAGFGQVVVLVDGIRINDSQTGHHNSDIPIPLSEIERIEVLTGAASALYGADAVGGAINVITRRQAKGMAASLSAGGDGFVAVEGTVGAQAGSVSERLAASLSRSDGFMYDREFVTGSVSSRTDWGSRTSLLAAFTRKAFGANGFYGPSPSKEWTDQTLVALDRTLIGGGTWTVTDVTSYRTHGDRFLWDVRQPGINENHHRTHAVATRLKAYRTLATSTTLNLGGEAAAEWIRSSALGDHTISRGSLFGEVQHRFSPRVSLVSGLRFDAYSTFGQAFSPSAALTAWSGPETKWRAAVGRTFRAPTFTERYYRDPAHLGTPSLSPETGWEGEAGGDHFWGGGWMTTATVFRRVEHGLIDWARENPSAIWRTTNLGRVRTQGVETNTSGRLAGVARGLGFQYSFVDLDAGASAQQLKYSQDYARHTAAMLVTLRLPWQVDLTTRAGYTRRVDGRTARVWDARGRRRFGALAVVLEGTNLLDDRYQETRGVDMPGRWIRAVVEIGSR